MGRAGTSFINSILASADFINISLLKAVHTGAAIKLLSKHLVGLAEAVKFASKVTVLRLKSSSMSFKSLLLSQIISVGLSVLLVHQTLAFHISAAYE